jgi:cell division protein FtsN
MGGRSARERDIMTAGLLETEFTKLGMGKPAPTIIAMSPLVLDDDEAAAAEAAESAKSFRPEETRPQPTAPSAGGGTSDASDIISQAPRPAPVLATEEVGQGDTADQARRPADNASAKWGIQVGAHASRPNAEAQLRTVKKDLRDLLAKSTGAIVSLDVSGNHFYRVRFGAFTPKKAESLCDQIQRRGVSCLVVTDGAWDKATSRATLPIAVR